MREPPDLTFLERGVPLLVVDDDQGECRAA